MLLATKLYTHFLSDKKKQKSKSHQKKSYLRAGFGRKNAAENNYQHVSKNILSGTD
jgi:hypothetical protein